VLLVCLCCLLISSDRIIQATHHVGGEVARSKQVHNKHDEEAIKVDTAVYLVNKYSNNLVASLAGK
jgi:hypothetical protein